MAVGSVGSGGSKAQETEHEPVKHADSGGGKSSQTGGASEKSSVQGHTESSGSKGAEKSAEKGAAKGAESTGSTKTTEAIKSKEKTSFEAKSEAPSAGHMPPMNKAPPSQGPDVGHKLQSFSDSAAKGGAKGADSTASTKPSPSHGADAGQKPASTPSSSHGADAAKKPASTPPPSHGSDVGQKIKDFGQSAEKTVKDNLAGAQKNLSQADAKKVDQPSVGIAGAVTAGTLARTAMGSSTPSTSTRQPVDIGKEVGGWVNHAAKSVGTAAENTGKAISSGLDKATKSAGSALEGAAHNASTALESTAKKIGTAAENTGKAIGTAAEGAGKSIGSTIENASKSVSTSMQGTADKVGHTLEHAADKVGSSLESGAKSLGKGAEATAQSIHANLDGAAKAASTSLHDTAGKVGTSLENSGHSVGASVEKAGASLGSAAQGAGAKVNSSLEHGAQKIGAAAEGTAKAVSTAVHDGATKVGTSLEHAGQSAKTSVENAGHSVVSHTEKAANFLNNPDSGVNKAVRPFSNALALGNVAANAYQLKGNALSLRDSIQKGDVNGAVNAGSSLASNALNIVGSSSGATQFAKDTAKVAGGAAKFVGDQGTKLWKNANSTLQSVSPQKAQQFLQDAQKTVESKVGGLSQSVQKAGQDLAKIPGDVGAAIGKSKVGQAFTSVTDGISKVGGGIAAKTGQAAEAIAKSPVGQRVGAESVLKVGGEMAARAGAHLVPGLTLAADTAAAATTFKDPSASMLKKGIAATTVALDAASFVPVVGEFAGATSAALTIGTTALSALGVNY